MKDKAFDAHRKRSGMGFFLFMNAFSVHRIRIGKNGFARPLDPKSALAEEAYSAQ
jgi:hypothetical protein